MNLNVKIVKPLKAFLLEVGELSFLQVIFLKKYSNGLMNLKNFCVNLIT